MRRTGEGEGIEGGRARASRTWLRTGGPPPYIYNDVFSSFTFRRPFFRGWTRRGSAGVSSPIDWPRFHEQKSASAAARRRPGRSRTRRSLSLFVLDLLRERSSGIPFPSHRGPCAHANIVGVSCQGAARNHFPPSFLLFFLTKFCKILDLFLSLSLSFSLMKKIYKYLFDF